MNKYLFPQENRHLSHLHFTNLQWFRDSTLTSHISMVTTSWQPERNYRKKRESSHQNQHHHNPKLRRGHLAPVSKQADLPLAGVYDFLYLWRCITLTGRGWEVLLTRSTSFNNHNHYFKALDLFSCHSGCSLLLWDESDDSKNLFINTIHRVSLCYLFHSNININ